MTIGLKGLFRDGIGSGVGLRGMFDNGFDFGTGSPSTIITTQPAAYVNAGQNLSPVLVAKATTDGVSVDGSYTGAATATLTSGTGSIINNVVANCVAGVATFTTFQITDPTGGAGYQVTVTMPGYTPAVSNAFALVGAGSVAKMVAADAFVAFFSPGDLTRSGRVRSIRPAQRVAYNAGDPGVNMVTGHAHRWTDYRGNTTGGPDLIPGSGVDANGPTLVGTPGSGNEYLHGDGTQWMNTAAADALYALDGVTAVTIIQIVRASGNGGLGGIGRSPTAATVPYLMNAAVSGTYAGLTNPVTTARTHDTEVATSGATWRLMVTTRLNRNNGVSGMNFTSSGDPVTYSKIGGRAGAGLCGIPFANELYSPGDNYEVLLRQGATMAIADVAFQSVVTGEISGTEMAWLESWSVTNYNVTLDRSKRLKLNDGASHSWAANNSGVQAANPFPEYSVAQAIGYRGAMSPTQSFEAGRQKIIRAVSGRTTAQATLLFDTHVAPHLNAGDIVVIGDNMMNDLNGGGLTAAQIETNLLAYIAKVPANVKLVIWTPIDAGYFYSGSPATGAATGLSSKGTQALALITLLRNNYRTYGTNNVSLWDPQSDPRFKIDVQGNNGFGVQACSDATGLIYDSGAGGAGHLANGGQQIMGVLEATFFADNGYILYPPSPLQTACFDDDDDSQLRAA